MTSSTRFSPASTPVFAALFLASSLLSPAQLSTPAPLPRAAGPSKVRVLVTENMGESTVPKPSGAAEPGAPTAAPVAGKSAPKAGGYAAKGAKEAIYTHSTTKSLNVRVANLTPQPLDVTVKTTFLAKDEGDKNKIVTEKSVENKLTVVPGKSEEFKTEDVTFTHTTAHRQPMAGGGSLNGRGKIMPMEPASGHNYSGYKVEVYEGAVLVGSAASSGY